MKINRILTIAALIAVIGLLAIVSPGCKKKSTRAKKTVSGDVALCTTCGQVKGCDLCCKEGCPKCEKCGLAKGSPGCCKIPEGAESPVICGKCGQIKGTEMCCKPGQPKCEKCGLVKGSPGCCKITAEK